MSGPELDALIARVESVCLNRIEDVQPGCFVYENDICTLVSELKIYRAMSLRLERCVHELVKEAESCHP